MINEVTELLDALHDGRLTLEEVAHRFRERTWPRRRTGQASYAEFMAAQLDDPAPCIPGSYDDLAFAHHRGGVTDAQYEVLSRAIADAKRAEDARRAHDAEGAPGVAG